MVPLSTTVVETWSGIDYMQLGPIYPFVGGEVVLWILGLAFWIWFHWTQFRIEAREMQEDAAGAKRPELLAKVFAEEARG
jgi:hypothetical protein